MLKANELRIGNLVLYYDDGTEFKVTEIDQSGIAVRNEIEDTWIELDQFEGIPLTEEWMQKFGFTYTKYDNEGTWSKEIESGCRLDIDVNAVGFWYSLKNRTFDKQIRFVHELQNLFYGIMGQELDA